MKRALGLLLLTIAVLLALELVLPARGHWPPGTAVTFGLLGCAAIVGIAKGLGRFGLEHIDE